MSGGAPETDEETEAALQDPATRRCIVTGAIKPREQLIRFVIGPDHQVWPDLAEKLPGRGLWVSCEVGALDTAIRKNLFAKAARTAAKPAPDLAARVRAQLLRRLQDDLGLAKRSGAIIAGFAQLEPAVAQGQVALLLVATDAGADGRKKLAAKLPAETIISVLTAAEQGQALGHDQLVYVGVLQQSGHKALIMRIGAAAARLGGFVVAKPPGQDAEEMKQS